MKRKKKREEILEITREMVLEKGLDFIDIRTVSNKLNLAIGSIYYYFESKDELLAETIRSVFDDIFKFEDIDKSSFLKFMEDLFQHMEKGKRMYPSFFTIHSLKFNARGKEYMKEYLNLIKEHMLEALNNDKHLKKEAFNKDFTKEDFLNTILSSLIIIFISDNNNSLIILEMIKRSIY